ncbi:MAG: aminotransferase class I/II-fold pyridoxal phosphate-dependent enzyme, partial [Candidatus Heimdallarchaeota archaeon]|nr:aminotransferase class I/II-fold pyridoxal phosphate-dependent enzyme [Candidatus Heimdallarchaeota archaeon]
TTYGKALGGASGGCVSGNEEIVEMCRQRARPYLFSNAMAPPILAGSIKALEIVSRDDSLVKKSQWNSAYWRKGLEDMGYILKAGDTPIVPVMLYSAKLAQDISRDLYDLGVYAIGFFFPVVPKGGARIRTQMSAGLDKEHLDRALEAFETVGRKYDILGKDKKEIMAMYK